VLISEVSRRTGASIRSLRYYEQKRLFCARRLENGYRDLDEETVERVQTIQMYLGLGLNTEQIEEILNCAVISALPQPLPVCEEVLLTLYEEKLQDVEYQLTVLTALRTRLKERIACLQMQVQVG
jgi:MerR family transcriptional regulator, Zn(II)-responsive regulator of zntA